MTRRGVRGSPGSATTCGSDHNDHSQRLGMKLSSAQAELATIRMEIELAKALLKKAEANCGHWQRKLCG
eukprot:3180790-Pleurochrysis_carterae.AAC.1